MSRDVIKTPEPFFKGYREGMKKEGKNKPTWQIVGKEDDQSYRVQKRCHNCKLGIVVIIPKGKTIEGFLDSDEGRAIVCDNCGCQAFPLAKEEW